MRHGKAGSGSEAVSSLAYATPPRCSSRLRGTPKTAVTESEGTGPFANTTTVWALEVSELTGPTNGAVSNEKLGRQRKVGRRASTNWRIEVSRKSRQIRRTSDQSVPTKTRITSPARMYSR